VVCNLNTISSWWGLVDPCDDHFMHSV
jgi:hypothetical protein